MASHPPPKALPHSLQNNSLRPVPAAFSRDHPTCPVAGCTATQAGARGSAATRHRGRGWPDRPCGCPQRSETTAPRGTLRTRRSRPQPTPASPHTRACRPDPVDGCRPHATVGEQPFIRCLPDAVRLTDPDGRPSPAPASLPPNRMAASWPQIARSSMLFRAPPLPPSPSCLPRCGRTAQSMYVTCLRAHAEERL